MRKKVYSMVEICLLIGAIFAFAYILSSGFEIVTAQESSVCCEKTNYGAWCQNSETPDCDSDYRSSPTSCDSTSFCREGCCYDSQEGLCMENTPERVCEESNGTWSDSKDCDIDQCALGCCILSSEAALVTLTRCKKLSSFYGLNTDFRTNVADEVSCISVAQAEDEGACTYETEEFERILEEVIKLTGLKDPQAAMEAANKKLQKEIELEMERIKASKELMDEAEDWQKFGDLLAQMNQDQVNSFLGLLKDSIREFA